MADPSPRIPDAFRRPPPRQEASSPANPTVSQRDSQETKDFLDVPPAPPKSKELPRIEGYEILGILGRGGMGVVYKARHKKLNRLVALKMIVGGAHADAHELARFRTEAKAVASLKHPNIVQIHEIGDHDGLPYFTLEYCEGGSLSKRLAGTPLPAMKAAALVEILARAMQAAHQAGIVHRDLKPANVLLEKDGMPKIADFGLAKKLDDAGQTASGAVMGTPSYMAPEQASGKTKEIGPAADVYALGAILYELITGRPPFKAATPPRHHLASRQRRTGPAVALAAESAKGFGDDLFEVLEQAGRRALRQRFALGRGPSSFSRR